jgi:hypothetical protein
MFTLTLWLDWHVLAVSVPSHWQSSFHSFQFFFSPYVLMAPSSHPAAVKAWLHCQNESLTECEVHLAHVCECARQQQPLSTLQPASHTQPPQSPFSCFHVITPQHIAVPCCPLPCTHCGTLLEAEAATWCCKCGTKVLPHLLPLPHILSVDA